MNRMLSTIRWDVTLQARNGFYAATAFVLGMTALGVLQLPTQRLNLSWLLPAMTLNNLLITSFYFISALVLLEKTEGTLTAQVVTPLRINEYLGGKVATLVVLGVGHNLALALLFRGVSFNLLWLVAGIVFCAIIYILGGFAAVARYSSINAYLFPSLPIASALAFPLLPYALGWDHWLIYLHPMQAPVVLMQAAFAPVEGWKLAYAIGYCVLSTILAYGIAARAFRRFVVEQ